MQVVQPHHRVVARIPHKQKLAIGGIEVVAFTLGGERLPGRQPRRGQIDGTDAAVLRPCHDPRQRVTLKRERREPFALQFGMRHRPLRP